MIICLSGKIRLCKKYQSTKMYLFKNIKNHVLKWSSSFSTSSSTLLFTIYRLTQLVTHTHLKSHNVIYRLSQKFEQKERNSTSSFLYSIYRVTRLGYAHSQNPTILFICIIFWYACQYTAYWYKCIHTTGLHKKLVKVQNYQLI